MQFFYRKSNFLFPPLRRLFCNSNIAPFRLRLFSLATNLKQKIKVKKNEYNSARIYITGLNWFPVNDRFEQLISSMSFKFYSNTSSPVYDAVFKPAG